MSNQEAAGSVAEALQVLDALKREAQERQSAHLAEIDADIERLQQNITNLQAQVEALIQARADAEAGASDNSAELASAGYQRIFDALHGQAGRLAERTVTWTEAARALDARRAEALQSSDVAPLLEEYEAFRRDMEPNLGSLPPSYRKVVEAHHETVTRQLKERLESLSTVPSVEGEDVRIDVVTSSDVDEEGGVIMLVVPVSDEVHTGWAGRDADLQSLLAARVVEGVYTALRGTAIEGSQAMFGGHQGLLALEVELPPGVTGFGAKLRAALTQVLGDAPELAAARVTVGVTSVSVDLLLPPDDEEADA